MFLGHGVFRAVEAIEDELAEEWESDLAMEFDVLLSVAVDEVEVVAFGLAGDVDVFAQFDVAVRAEDEGAAIAPGAQAAGREPIDAEKVGGAVIGEQGRFAVVLELRGIRGCA